MWVSILWLISPNSGSSTSPSTAPTATATTATAAAAAAAPTTTTTTTTTRRVGGHTKVVVVGVTRNAGPCTVCRYL